MKGFLATVLGAGVVSAGAQLTTTPVRPSTTPVGPSTTPRIPSTTASTTASTTVMTSAAVTTAAVPTTMMTSTIGHNHMLKDEFVIRNLKSTQHGHQHDITFSVRDLSTWPEEMTKCHISWNGIHVRRGPAKCENGWFTAAITYYDDPQSLGLNINHAYGETCIGCNDEANDDYEGDVGSCTIMLDEDKMTELKSNGDNWESRAQRDLKCYVDFDD